MVVARGNVFEGHAGRKGKLCESFLPRRNLKNIDVCCRSSRRLECSAIGVGSERARHADKIVLKRVNLCLLYAIGGTSICRLGVQIGLQRDVGV